MSPSESPAARIEQRRAYDGPTFLKNGFRPFFLGAGVWSAFAMLAWLVVLLQPSVSPRIDMLTALEWHMHEMLFGFLAAAVAGFLLTAVPNWTGRLPVRGLPLGALALLWLAGRLAMLALPLLKRPGEMCLLPALIDSLFLPALAALMGREIVVGRNWRNLPVLALVAALALANVGFHLASQGWLGNIDPSRVAHAAILLGVLLITLIGGRIVPSFTRNWLAREGATALPAPFDHVDRTGAAAVTLAALLLVLLPDSPLTGVACLFAGAAHLLRLSRWQGLATLKEPLVTILHIGFAWVGVGFLLAGLAVLTGLVPFVAAVHAFAAGAIGTMVLAVMTRATRGHTGSPLEADTGTIAVFALAIFAALVRVGGAIAGSGAAAHTIAALAWIAAFALFVWLYLPLFLTGGGKRGE